MLDYLHELNEPQKDAVLHKEGALLIVAGAGAGKTKTIVHRIFHLIKSGADPASIVAVTFTNKAAQEMRDRISTLLQSSGQWPVTNGYLMPFIGTFHSLGAHILRHHGRAINLRRNFAIKDKDDSRALIRDAMREQGIDPRDHAPAQFASVISKNKGILQTAENFRETFESADVRHYFMALVADVWERYESLLTKESALDFDDLLLKPYLLFLKQPEILEHYQNRWKHLLIDEYQDTNTAQYTITKMLATKHKNICVVGDDSQNIYTWRGANIKNLLRFEKDYPGTKIIFLEENYRSTQTILNAANKVIEKNKLRIPKNLFTKKDAGEKITLAVAPTGGSEAAFVAEKAKKLIEENKIIPEEIAVLYRTNFQSRALEEACLSLDLPYQVLGTRFFERKEVKDILSFIRAALNPESLSDIKRIINIPPRGIGKVTLVKLFAGQQKSLPPATQKNIENFYIVLEKIKRASEKISPDKLITLVFKETGIEKLLQKDGIDGEERALNIKELVTLASRYPRATPEATTAEQLEKFLEDAALATDQDSLHENRKGIRLMTVHAAKGLEFEYVFVVGLEQGLFPHERKNEIDPASASSFSEAMEEERRLFYVALTRAKKKLFLSCAETRIIFGQLQTNAPSEFLKDIPAQLMDIEYTWDKEKTKEIEYD